jgi:hypothetical protein
LRDRKPALWTVIGSLLGLVLLYAATRQVDLHSLKETFATTDIKWTAAVLASAAGFIAIKAWRWGLLLRFVPGLRFSRLHAAVYVGLAVNFLIAHAGEFLRAALIARQNEVSMSAVIATVMVERALDFIALLLILAILSVAIAELPTYFRTALVVTGGFAVMAVLALYLLLHTPHWLRGIVEAVGGTLPPGLRAWCVNQITLSRTGLIAIGDVRRMMIAVAASVLQWLLVILAVWCSARAVGVTATIVPVAATFVLLIVGLMLPNSPMQIGTTQLAFAIGLGTGGVTATAAVAASLVYTLFLILPIMVVGGFFLLRSRRVAATAVP